MACRQVCLDQGRVPALPMATVSAEPALPTCKIHPEDPWRKPTAEGFPRAALGMGGSGHSTTPDPGEQPFPTVAHEGLKTPGPPMLRRGQERPLPMSQAWKLRPRNGVGGRLKLPQLPGDSQWELSLQGWSRPRLGLLPSWPSPHPGSS